MTTTYYGARVGKQRGSEQTVTLFGGLWEVVVGGARKAFYGFGGQQVAVRDSGQGLSYLHGDHLGSVSVETGAGGAVVGRQEYDPWGTQRGTELLTRSTRTFTGQQQDATGLLNYNARMYDPALGRFISADSIVPGGKQQALTPLTVDFHEPGFVGGLNGETAWTQGKGFAFQLSSRDRQQAKNAQGPGNPQALNRYSYTLNNPLKYADPSGHAWYLTQDEAAAMALTLRGVANDWSSIINAVKVGDGISAVVDVVVAIAAQYNLAAAWAVALGGSIALAVVALGVMGADALSYGVNEINNIAFLLESANVGSGLGGVELQFADNGLYALNRNTGALFYLDTPWWIDMGLPSSLLPGSTYSTSPVDKSYWNFDPISRTRSHS